MRSKKRSRVWLAALPLYLFTILFVAGPLIYMVVLSFMSKSDSWGIEAVFTLRNYERIGEPVYRECFVQSLKLAFTTTFLTGLIGYPFGYFMAKLSPSKKRLLLLLIMIPFWTSSLIRLYGWMIILQAKGVLYQTIRFLGFEIKPLKLLYSYPAVVVGMVYALLPFMMLAVYSSVDKMDWNLVEAARDLGASAAKAFWTVTFRLTLPGLLSGVILTFVPSMGLFFIADILGGNKIVLVGSLIQDQLTRGADWPFAAALSVVLMTITTLLLILYRRIANTGELEGIV
ncbi:MAG: ABC transporter permease [Lachnospiraceae bacterium]|nr:ABC transporter permease [Lachnospiraceae bacterium]